MSFAPFLAKTLKLAMHFAPFLAKVSTLVLAKSFALFLALPFLGNLHLSFSPLEGR